MGTWSKAKNALEWMQLAKFVGDCLVTVASWKAIRTVLAHVAHLSSDWASVISYLCAGFVLLGIVWWQQRSRNNHGKQTVQTQPRVDPGPTQFQNVEDFYRTYDNTLLRETEINVRKLSDQYQPGSDRERFFIRLVASGVVIFIFELIWVSIFRSQIRGLEQLNGGPLRIDDLRPHYQQATTEYPQVYGKYSFEQWLAFLRTQILIKDHPRGLEITVRGREFLKYLIQTGRSAGGRSF